MEHGGPTMRLKTNTMTKINRAAIAFAAACLALGAVSALAAPPPAEAFFERPVFSSARHSPDGRSVAMLAGAKGARMQLAVLDLQTLKPDVVAAFGNDDVGSFEWVNDSRLVFDLDVQFGSHRCRTRPVRRQPRQ